MNLFTFVERLGAVPAAPGPATRRDILAQLGRAAVAALPLGLATLPAAATPQNTSYDAVTLLLLLERTQKSLYTLALAAPGLVPLAQVVDFQRMLTQQTQHEGFLVRALQNAGAVIPAAPAFDFSGRRNVPANPVLFPNVLSSYDEFLALAQQLEDLGVGLYQAQARVLVGGDNQLAQVVLRIHSVEARHAAHVRGLRRSRGAVVKPWPSDSDAPITRPAAAQVLGLVAANENNTAQSLATAAVPFLDFLFLRDTGVRPTALAEAFDEPVSSAAALAALALFS